MEGHIVRRGNGPRQDRSVRDRNNTNGDDAATALLGEAAENRRERGYIRRGSHVQRVTDALGEHARRLAAADHPDAAARLRAAQLAGEQYHAAATAYHQTRDNLQQRSHLPVSDTNAASRLPELTELTERVEHAQHRVRSADQLIERLSDDPAINSHPDPRARLQQARTGWVTEQAAAHQQAASRESGPVRSIRHDPAPIHHVDHGRSLGR